MQLYPDGKGMLHKEKLTELYEETYNLYTKDAYRILASVEEAQDIIQEVFLKIHEQTELMYRICNMDLSSARCYIRTMIHNEACNRRRKMNAEAEPPPELEMERNKSAEILLNEIFKSIPLEDRILLTAYYKHPDLTLDDFAEMTGMSRSTVSRHLRRAKEALKQELKQRGIRPPDKL